MTIIFYIAVGIFTAAMLAGAACAVSKAGEKENICDYSKGGDK